MTVFISCIAFLLIFTAILLVSALGGLFSEKSGVMALSLEGNMVMGALTACILMKVLPSSWPPAILCIFVIIGAIVGAMIYSLLLGVATIIFKANQVLIGTALNILANAIAVVVVKVLTATPLMPGGKPRISFTAFYDYFSFTFPGAETVKFNWLIFIIFAILPLAYFVLKKTKFGLRLCSAGENPSAADSVGINVNKMRFAGVLICGALSGLGGLALILTGAEWDFTAGANGFGYLALAVLIFGQWKPFMVAVGSLAFAVFKTLSLVLPNILVSDSIKSYFYLALPYIVCLIALMFTSKKNCAPKACGIPYNKEER